MGRHKKQLLSYLLLIFSLLLPILLYSGLVNPFAPLHVVPIYEAIYYGHGGESFNTRTPGFYSLGSIISLIAGISARTLMFLPLQLLPFILTIYLLFWKISGSRAIANLVSLIYATTANVEYFFFWMHGIGSIFFFIITYFIIKMLRGTTKDSKITIIILIVATSLIYTSYDVTFGMLLFLISIIFFILFINKNIVLSKGFFIVLIYMLTVLLGMHGYVYDIFVKQTVYYRVGITGFEKFIASYISQEKSGFPWKDMLIAYPKIISILGLIKYGILLTFIFLGIVYMVKQLKISRNLNSYTMVFLAILIANIGYLIARLPFGYLSIGSLFLPGIVGLCFIYRHFKDYKRRVSLLLIGVIIVCANSVNYLVLSSEDLINRDLGYYKYVEISAGWYSEYKDDSKIGLTDVLTKSFFWEHICHNIIKKGEKLPSIYSYFWSDPAYVLSVVKKGKNDSLKSAYYILNIRLNTLEFDAWVTTKSWQYYLEVIDSDFRLNRIYDSRNIIIIEV
ncbi:hypothetical protein TON_1854 [Thermococcus onnurineus NA1]|uniref:Glycosyltransferase RgtA/B/C/D-like domain-containing protein n=1 Tax=Thermococcus onnurineus (strain NA1) TaxID=523850 RepID=B6YVM1_THEON|nr:hypothetical protein [Thermococcus onnurineus]ACJ17345.1 hypothetical protein TON_1854 [Thermococcus onnurineus NA1]